MMTYFLPSELHEIHVEEKERGARLITDFDQDGRIPTGPRCPGCQKYLVHDNDCAFPNSEIEGCTIPDP